MKSQGGEETNNQSLPLIPKLERKVSSGSSSHASILEEQRQSLPLSRRVEIFVCTFLVITSVHALRTTYSFSKSYLPDEIDMNEKLIGIVDSVMLLFVGLGNFLIAVHPLSKPVRAVWVALLFCALQYCLVPISMKNMTGSGAFAVLLILMGLSGFLQSFMWPNLLPLVHSVWSPDKDTTLLGFWPTSTNFGNILGFVVCQLIVLKSGLSWEISMFIVAIYMAIIAIYMAFRIDEMPNQSFISADLKHPQHEETTQPHMAGSQRSDSHIGTDLQRTSQTDLSKSTGVGQETPPIIEVFKKSPRVTLLTISFSLLKSVMYGILLWLPAYFYSIGLVEYSLYIPMTFDGASILGSTLLGAVFKRLPPHKKNLALIPVLFLLLIFFIMLKAIDFSVAGYFIIIGLVGLCLGGTYNTMAVLVTMQLVRTIPPQKQSNYLRFYSALLMAIANTITGITQTIIGYTVGEDEGALFGIFVVYTAINLCSMVGVVFIEMYGFHSTNSPNNSSQTQIEPKQDDKLVKSGQNGSKYKQIEITEIK